MASQRLGKELQGDISPELEIFSGIDNSHAAASQLFRNAKVRDCATRVARIGPLASFAIGVDSGITNLRPCFSPFKEIGSQVQIEKMHSSAI
jgi:hypothetical protein